MARRILPRLGYVLALIALTLAMVLLHLPTRPGRNAVRDVTNALLAATFRGQLRIGDVSALDLRGNLVAIGITLHDPHGDVVFDGGTLVATPLNLLWRGI